MPLKEVIKTNFLKKIACTLVPHKFLITFRSFQILFSKKALAEKHKCCGFLLLTPQHDNLGDHAIAFSEISLFEKQGLNVVEITGKELNTILKRPALFKKLIGDKTIFFQGGGYLGTLWFDAELQLRKVMQLCPQNRKIIFPQTIFYENSQFGYQELEKSIEIYNKDDHLTIMAREESSYEYMKAHYCNNIYLMPDMVLYLKPNIQKYKRNGAMTLFRSDLEKTMDDSEREVVIKYLKSKLKDVELSDMFSKETVLLSKYRENALNEKFAQISSKKLVVTDRLHGMIFCAITGTPCIVLNSKSPKVKGIYDWFFKDCEYIFFMEKIDLDRAESFIDSVCSKTYEYDNSYLQPYYDKLVKMINGAENIE